MASEMTGSTLPMRVAHPDAAPLLSRSKLGMSIDGIPSLRGPPDLISSRGTVCCEKSVWGHSARQLNGSAVALPTIVAARAPTAATISTVVRVQITNLNGSPLRISISSQRLQISICVDFDVHYSLGRLRAGPKSGTSGQLVLRPDGEVWSAGDAEPVQRATGPHIAESCCACRSLNCLRQIRMTTANFAFGCFAGQCSRSEAD